MLVIESTSAESRAARSVGRGTRWMFESGIQAASGGCHAWFDADRGYQVLYPEVTGYHLTFAEWIADRTEDDTARTSAVRSAAWLASLIDPAGGFPCLVGADNDPDRRARAADPSFLRKASRHYTFDAGTVLQGLTAFAQRTRSARIRTAALSLGHWLVQEQHRDGTFTPFTGSEDWRTVPADWSTRPGCHQAKVAIGLLALAEMESESAFVDAGVRAVRAGLALQQPDGRFITNSRSGATNVHPHSYAAEACWAVGVATDDRELISAARRATRFVLDESEPGSAFRTYRPGAGIGSSTRPMRIDGLAQTLRLAVLTGAGSDQECAALAATLLEHQGAAENRHVDGGFRFGFSSGGEPLPHVNVWVTAFAAQALHLYTSRNALSWKYLV